MPRPEPSASENAVLASRDLLLKDTAGSWQMHSLFGETNPGGACCAWSEKIVALWSQLRSGSACKHCNAKDWQSLIRRPILALREWAPGERLTSSGSDTMSIFGKIMGAIFGTKAEAAPADASAGSAGTATAAPAQTVDIVPILETAAAAKKEKLNWRTSIVDLMKVLDLDSSLAARKELAKELGYTGDTNDSAKMNVWLHKQVMNKLAANGGKVPDELK
jgi:hypothetical protein